LCSKGGESSIFKNCKTLLNTKRRILFRGSFILVKGKTFETGGENFKSWKCFLQSYSYTFDYLQKAFEMIFTKNLQNKTRGANVVQNFNKEENHPSTSFEISILVLTPSNLCTYIMQTSSIMHFYLLWFVLASITKKGEIEREIGSNLFQ
jgi:hypothetical protein